MHIIRMCVYVLIFSDDGTRKRTTEERTAKKRMGNKRTIYEQYSQLTIKTWPLNFRDNGCFLLSPSIVKVGLLKGNKSDVSFCCSTVQSFYRSRMAENGF